MNTYTSQFLDELLDFRGCLRTLYVQVEFVLFKRMFSFQGFTFIVISICGGRERWFFKAEKRETNKTTTVKQTAFSPAQTKNLLNLFPARAIEEVVFTFIATTWLFPTLFVRFPSKKMSSPQFFFLLSGFSFLLRVFFWIFSRFHFDFNKFTIFSLFTALFSSFSLLFTMFYENFPSRS